MGKTKKKNKSANSTKLVLGVVSIDAQKNCSGKSELYTNWYDCPNCGNRHVLLHDNYCSKCGCKFKWSD